MAVTILIKDSQEPGESPQSLAKGEFAVNTRDRAVWVGDENGVPQLLVRDSFRQESAPTNAKVNAFWFKPSTKQLSIYDGVSWQPAALSTLGGQILGNISVLPNATDEVFSTSISGTSTTGNSDVSGKVNAVEGFFKGGIEIINTPPGITTFYCGIESNPAPAGWLYCDGAVYDGSLPENVPLFTAIGRQFTETTQGGDFFRVPDLRGLTPRFHTGTRTDEWADPDRIDRVNHREDQAGDTGIAGNFPGTLQKSALEDHAHNTRFNTENRSGGGGVRCLTNRTGFNFTRASDAVRDANATTETRASNVALLAVIKR